MNNFEFSLKQYRYFVKINENIVLELFRNSNSNEKTD